MLVIEMKKSTHDEPAAELARCWPSSRFPRASQVCLAAAQGQPLQWELVDNLFGAGHKVTYRVVDLVDQACGRTYLLPAYNQGHIARSIVVVVVLMVSVGHSTRLFIRSRVETVHACET